MKVKFNIDNPAVAEKMKKVVFLDKNAGEYICHSQLKEFDGFEDGIPKCK